MRLGGGAGGVRFLLLLGAVVVASLATPGASSAAVSWTGASTLERGASCSDPCLTLIGVVRTGSGRVQSDRVGDGGRIDCGTRCLVSFYGVASEEVVLTPVEGAFRGWEVCPIQDGPSCRVPMDGAFYCVKVVFAGSGVAGQCPDPTQPLPPTGPGTQQPQQPYDPKHPPRDGAPCTMTGTAAPDVLTGTTGNDVICGLGGEDLIDGGRGADLVRGGPGGDRLTGGPDYDKVDGGPGDDVLAGDAGNDRLRGERGRDRLFGDAGADTLDGGGGVDSFSGGGGSDSLLSRDRVRETVNGGRGTDRARADASDRVKSVERRF